MKLELNNLAALVQGRDMNLYQRSLAIAEFQSVIEFLQQLKNTEQANGDEQSESTCNLQNVGCSALTKIKAIAIRTLDMNLKNDIKDEYERMDNALEEIWEICNNAS